MSLATDTAEFRKLLREYHQEMGRKGGKTVTPKKLASLAKARAAKKAKGNKNG